MSKKQNTKDKIQWLSILALVTTLIITNILWYHIGYDTGKLDGENQTYKVILCVSKGVDPQICKDIYINENSN